MSVGDAGTILDGLTVERSYAGNLRDGTLGGALRADSGQVRISNCTFRSNTEMGVWGWIHLVVRGSTFVGHPKTVILTAGLDVADSVFLDNGGGIGAEKSGTHVSNCESRRNSGGVATFGQATIQNCTFDSHEGRAVSILSGTGMVTNCTFVNGAFNAVWVSSAGALVDRCTFVGNRYRAVEGSFANLLVRNSLLTGNRSGAWGGAIQLSHGTIRVRNCTLFANGDIFGVAPAGIEVWEVGTQGFIENTVVWGEPGNPFNSDETLIEAVSGATISIDNSVVEGWTGTYSGVGNSGADPLFVDALGPDLSAGTEDDDLRLAVGSPGIDTGDPEYLPGAGDADLDGKPRMLCGRVDVGAYEFGLAGDLNCDFNVDLTDYQDWADCRTGPDGGPYLGGCEAFDFNADLAIDLSDFAGFARALSQQP